MTVAKRIIVIGAGFGGMSAATYLAKQGHNVTVLEKNATVGGRAQVERRRGFTFDLGPSWYMMPDVFEEYFSDFNHKPSDFYVLKKLKPSYVVAGKNRQLEFGDVDTIKKMISGLEPKALKKFQEFYDMAKQDYADVRKGILTEPMIHMSEALQPDVLKFLLRPAMYQSYQSKIESVVKDDDLRHALQFMAVFMGGSPKDISAIYSLLSYVDMGLGVYYPMGGFGVLAESFMALAKQQGVTFMLDAEVQQINSSDDRVTSVTLKNNQKIQADIVVANADYHHVDQQLVSPEDRQYSQKNWRRMTLSPSALLLTIGIKKKLPKLAHHTLFLETDWEGHFADIKSKSITKNPLFYVSTPSKTDASVAPKGHENLFVLAPMPHGVMPTMHEQESIANNIISRLEEFCGTTFADKIVMKDIKTSEYFEERFNALGGNAFGPAHTLKQSAIFRPRMRSSKLKNLYFAGQYTNPGTGVPMVVLSGKAVAKLIQKDLNG